LVGQTGAAERPTDLAAVLTALDGPLSGEPALVRGIVLALMDVDSPTARERLIGAKGGRLARILEGALAEARTTAMDEARPIASRTPAIRALRFAGLPEVEGLLAELMAPRHPSAVQTEAIATLAHFNDPRVAAMLIRQWPGLSPRFRDSAAE